MASDQMLPNSSKKQQQLEAGKKRLEEFRKKKAAAKKTASNNSDQSTNGDRHETKPPVPDTVPVKTDTTYDIGSGFNDGKNEKKTINVLEAEPDVNPISSLNKPFSSPEPIYSTGGKLDHNAPYEVDPLKNKAFYRPEEHKENVYGNSNQFSNIRLEDALKNSRVDNLKELTSRNPVTTQVSITKSLFDQPANGPTYRVSSPEVSKSVPSISDHRQPPVSSAGDMNHDNRFEHPASDSNSYFKSSESISTNFSSEAVPSHNQTSMSAVLAGRRSRPSFLDSVNVSGNADADKPNPFSSKVHPVDARGSFDSQNVMNDSVADVADQFRKGINELDMEKRSNYNSTKQNEDFAALEQHIEDLTQEKFSLQRALEASRVLAESLATENSALTDSYNQQGGVVNQLKADMESLQDEINAQLVELEALRTEYRNAQLECSAADERAKLLASEVIVLEEKVLRLRSNELKLERQLENLEAEMSSQKRKISSLEKDRQDLHSTINALQEEKKLMQSKLRKAPAIVGIKKSPITKKEASTSTDDLDESEDTLPATTNLAIQATLGESDASLQSLSRNFGLEVSSSSIPSDQLRIIENINTLISELTLEKEELIQALSTESSLSSKLKNLNKELTHKLEVQTQRLELLTSQSMVSDNIPSRTPGPVVVVDNTPYADEGDEVVERVLGWIMKLFPGGPSRRQTKHL
ncbi:putative protein BLISTER [Helianthus annuus]|nr:putative protein BLISTER [Helianthus annuus]